jgi:heme exporter protein D
MGGYALFVWGSFGAAALVLLWNILAPRWRRAQVLKTLVSERDEDGDQES